MFLINIIIYFLGKYSFRIVLILFGWAEKIFLGKSQFNENIRIYSFIGISLLWVYVLISSVVSIKDIFSEIPDRQVADFIRTILMTSGSFILPFSGGIVLFGKKEKASEYIKSGVLGFLYCPLMAAAFISMVVLGLVIVGKRFIKKEIALFFEFNENTEKEYIEKEIICGLKKDFGEIFLDKPPIIYCLPNKILGVMGGDKSVFQIRDRYLRGKDFKIFINNDDLMIEACKFKCHAVKIKIAEYFLKSKKIYLTSGKLSAEIEKDAFYVYKMWENGKESVYDSINKLEYLEKNIEKEVEFQDWEFLKLKILLYKTEILLKRRDTDWKKK